MNALRPFNPISRGAEWNFELIQAYDEEIRRIAVEEYGLDVFPNQIEVIASEQMLDAYASMGLPIGYPHWSHGKEFLRNEQRYRKGAQGLAYEIVINANPCIAYLMEENSMPMQALVIAHACYGHNSFFKGNYLFRQWTNPDAIIDYMVFARHYVLECEEKYGVDAVEEILDSAHALMQHGVDRYHHPTPLSAEEEAQRQRERAEHDWRHFDDIWRTLPPGRENQRKGKKGKPNFPPEPQENLLYFIEKHSPLLKPWQREIVRIVRKVAQYFYPQGMTKLMNEGWACFWHYKLLHRLYDLGRVDDAFMLEVLASHTNVVFQPGYDHPAYSGINPYALGFAMFQDLERICTDPDEEDREWFPGIAGSDWRETLDFAMRNYKDESFIGQYLSPRLMRRFRLFAIADREDAEELLVDSIHDEQGYRQLRQHLARQYHRDQTVPDIQVVNFDVMGDRTLTLRHQMLRGRPLADEDANEVMKHLARLWGYRVRLESISDDEPIESREMMPA